MQVWNLVRTLATNADLGTSLRRHEKWSVESALAELIAYVAEVDARLESKAHVQ